MSSNLVELIRRHHAHDAPTALAVLKDAIAERGEITDDDRREAASRSGLVCTGTACLAATNDAHVNELRAGLGLDLGQRSGDGALSLAQTVCLGYCHASPAVRVGDTIDAGPGVIDRVLKRAERAAPEPRDDDRALVAERRVGVGRRDRRGAGAQGQARRAQVLGLHRQQPAHDVRDAGRARAVHELRRCAGATQRVRWRRPHRWASPRTVATSCSGVISGVTRTRGSA